MKIHSVVVFCLRAGSFGALLQLHPDCSAFLHEVEQRIDSLFSLLDSALALCTVRPNPRAPAEWMKSSYVLK